MYYCLIHKEPQPYDSALKSLFGNEAAVILPRLIEGIKLISEQNVEIDRTTLRADLVYNVLYEGEPHILNLELQTGADTDMPKRMLTYHVGLLVKHNVPVLSVILYPFETTLPEPPFIERSGTRALLQFDYRVLPVWKQDAQQIVQDHVIPMYTLLPVMRNASVPLLVEAMKEMRQYYTPARFGNHFARFKRFLQRSTTLTEQEKQMVNNELYEYDSLLDENPEIQERVAKGETKGAQKIVTDMVEFRFPTLAEEAHKHVMSIQSVDMLSQLAKQIAVAKDEQTARWVLETYAA
ncbi:MAG: hypothetical protein NVSMB38_22300 [Ktedonobacteraceae bacterium]